MLKKTALELIDAKVKICKRCPNLCENRTNTVFGEGNFDADVVFIGEAPGKDEDAKGQPFVGAAGQFLNKIIKACGWIRNKFYIINFLKCPPQNTPPPANDEAENCKTF